MKLMKIWKVLTVCTAALAFCCFPAISNSQIVYQDNFDDDGVDINAGIGGGGETVSFNNAPDWTDDGNDLFAGDAGAGFHIWRFNSLNSFDLSNGFSLEVVLDQQFIDENGSNSMAPFLANHFSIGLSSDPSVSGNFIQTNGSVPESEGIGVSLTTRNGNVDIGVLEWDLDAETTTTLDPITTPPIGNGMTFTLDVDTAGNYSWTFEGESGSGTTALDLSLPFFFTARTQGSSGNRIQSVTLSTTGVSGGDIPPTMFTTFRGIALSAALSDFVDSDDVVTSHNPGFTISNLEAPVWLIFDSNGAGATGVRVESSAGTPGLEYTVEAFNWAAGMYDIVGTQTELFGTDQVVNFPIVPADHVDTNGDLRTRIGWRRAGFTINFPWEVNVDQVVWTQ